MFNLGIKIKEKRKLLMLTQQELANRCELTKGYISQLENNMVSPSLETLEIILEVLGTTLSEFFKDDDKKQIVFTEEEQYDNEEQYEEGNYGEEEQIEQMEEYQEEQDNGEEEMEYDYNSFTNPKKSAD